MKACGYFLRGRMEVNKCMVRRLEGYVGKEISSSCI